MVRKERPTDSLLSQTTRIETGYGDLYITISEVDKEPFEIFIIIGKGGGALMAKAEAIGRLCSLAMRHGIPTEEIIEQLSGIADDKPKYTQSRLIKSIPDAVAWTLSKYIHRSPQDKKESILVSKKKT